MKQNQVDINLEKEQSTIDKENIEERAEFWNEQLEYYENVNVNLQSLIETYAMSLLAEEKNFFVPDEKIETEVDKLLKQIENNESIKSRKKTKERRNKIKKFQNKSGKQNSVNVLFLSWKPK